MVAGNLRLKLSKASHITQLKEKIIEQINTEYPDLTKQFYLFELRLGSKLTLPESVRLYSLFHKGKSFDMNPICLLLEVIKVTAILKPIDRINIE